jgi:hypothetical protein
MTPYRHTQAGTVVRWAVLAGLLPLPALYLLPIPPMLVVVIVTVLVSVPVLLIFLLWSLTIEVSPAHFKFWFGPGWIGKTVPMARVAGCEPMDKKIMAWGIHWAGPTKGWLYNVSGFQAVVVSLEDGTRFMVGTDEPQAVCEAVAKAQATLKAMDQGTY